MGGKIQVRVDAEIKDLVPDYLDHRRRDLAAMFRDWEASDLTKLRAWGHKFRGSGKVYGFEEITRLGILIEQAATDSETAKIKPMLDQLQVFLDSVEVVYQEIPPA